MGQVKIYNTSDAALCVLVEPLGNDYWLSGRQTLTLTIPDDVPTVAWYDSGASVWINVGDCDDFAVRTETGEAVECGYQRPPGAFDFSSGS